MVEDLTVSLAQSLAALLWLRKLNADMGLLGQDYMIGEDKVHGLYLRTVWSSLNGRLLEGSRSYKVLYSDFGFILEWRSMIRIRYIILSMR